MHARNSSEQSDGKTLVIKPINVSCKIVLAIVYCKPNLSRSLRSFLKRSMASSRHIYDIERLVSEFGAAGSLGSLLSVLKNQLVTPWESPNVILYKLC